MLKYLGNSAKHIFLKFGNMTWKDEIDTIDRPKLV